MSASPDIVERWREVTAKLDPETAAVWKDGPVGHFLHAFRPDGARLPELFAGMPEMAPALERLRTLFHRGGAETGSMYLDVTRPKAMDDDAVRQGVRRWLGTVGSLVQSFALPVDEDVARFLTSGEAAVDVVERGAARATCIPSSRRSTGRWSSSAARCDSMRAVAARPVDSAHRLRRARRRAGLLASSLSCSCSTGRARPRPPARARTSASRARRGPGHPHASGLAEDSPRRRHPARPPIDRSPKKIDLPPVDFRPPPSGIPPPPGING